MILKKLGVPYVISKASNDLHGQILQRLGADRVVFPEKETALRLAHGISVPEVVDYLSISTDMGINKLKVPKKFVVYEGERHAIGGNTANYFGENWSVMLADWCLDRIEGKAPPNEYVRFNSLGQPSVTPY